METLSTTSIVTWHAVRNLSLEVTLETITITIVAALILIPRVLHRLYRPSIKQRPTALVQPI